MVTRSTVLLAALQRPTGILPLVFFRIGFGCVLFISTLRFMANGWVEAFYIQPTFHFTYYGFDWLRPLSGAGMPLLFIGMALLALMLALGALYRVTTIVFFALFTYVELLDKAFYLNHYYLVSLLSFLLIFLPAHGKWSVDAWLRPSIRRDTVPLWMLGVLRLQLALVYLFAGIAKLDGDWLLRGLPLRIWLPARASTPLIGSLFDYPAAAFLLSWGGMLYDLTISVWLLWRRTRWLAYSTVVIFHVLTALLFPVIGMFPYIMLVATLIFFSEGDYRALGRRFGAGRAMGSLDEPAAPKSLFRGRLVAPLLVIYFGIQIVLPLRHHLYPGDVNWTDEGFNFAWRVMLVEKSGYATFTVRDPAAGTTWAVYPDDYLTPQQERQMAFQPDMLLQFAHYLREHYAAMGYPAVEVYAEASVSFNGRPGQLLIDPTVDLAREVRDLGPKRWILPLLR